MKNILVLLIVIFVCISCEKPKVSYHGRVINSTGIPVDNATVTVDHSGTTHTDAQGNFTASVTEGSHTITVDAPGYDPTPVTINTEASRSGDLTLLGSADIQGLVVDSQTGEGLSNAQVYFSVDNNPVNTSSAEMMVHTNYDGSFVIHNGPTGSFYCIIIINGYFPRVLDQINIIAGTNGIDQQTIVEKPSPGSIRIILTWGDYPEDLDSHLSGPTLSGTRFHLFYANQNPVDDVNLDVDDVSSYGPETVTISALRDGVYRYSVHNYSNQDYYGGQEIEQSPAIVEVYSYDGLLKKYEAPPFTGTGNTWQVFEINVSSNYANIVSKNIYVLAEYSEDMAIFKGLPRK